jgi:hypothetical protein
MRAACSHTAAVTAGCEWPQQKRAVPAEIINQPWPIDRPLVRAGGPLDVDRKGFQAADVVRHPVGEKLARFPVQLLRTGEALRVLGGQVVGQ